MLKKVALNYKSAVGHTKPVTVIPVDAGTLNKLDRVIREKLEQNERERICSRDKTEEYWIR